MDESSLHSMEHERRRLLVIEQRGGALRDRPRRPQRYHSPTFASGRSHARTSLTPPAAFKEASIHKLEVALIG